MSTQRVFLSPPDMTEAEAAALQRAMASGWVAPLGPEVEAFEAELAARSDRQYCVLLSSGTAALHLGLLALGIGAGDHVLTSSMTFAATANAITYTGATPVFVDADATGNIDVDLLAEALADLEHRGTPAKAIVPVDLFGKIVDHAAIARLATEHGIPVLSDAAESLGARRDGVPAPGHGIAAAVSFNGNKIITTSGGGALLTDEESIAGRVRHLATQAREPVVHYEHKDVGYNYRLSNLLAAMGREQLARLDQMMARRHEHRRFYGEVVAPLPGVELFGEPSGQPGEATHDNWWLSSLLIDPEQAGFSAEDLRQRLQADNIESRPMWKPMHLQPIYRGHLAFVNGTSESLFGRGLSLPSGSVLTDVDRARVGDIIRELAR